jgi:hypothetical protein
VAPPYSPVGGRTAIEMMELDAAGAVVRVAAHYS